MTTPRTSDTHPIRVDWLDTPWSGRVGLTFAPGKRQSQPLSGAPWERSLPQDLDRLVTEYSARLLVSLVEDHELDGLGISELVSAADKRGLKVLRFPIADQGVPAALGDVAAVVNSVVAIARSGENVVIHCMGGLGRAGTIGGCLLVAAGDDARTALRKVGDARGPRAPENEIQRRFVASFADHLSRTSSPTRRSRVLGAVLGAAIGDAIGHPTEFIGSFEAIRRSYPPAGVTGYTLFWERDGNRFAPYTDDTQMAEVVLRALLHARTESFDLDATMEHMAAGFIEWSNNPQGGHRDPGGACLAGCHALEAGTHWSEAGEATAGGCGSVMRAYPFGLVFAEDPATAEQWAVEHSKLTHRDPIALAASAAMALAVAAATRGEEVDSIQAALIDGASRYSSETAVMIERALKEALGGVEPEVTLSRLRGWAAHEAIAAGAYVFSRHPDDPRAAILEAANTPGDSDSIATIAGALLGAHLGLEALPAVWVSEVERSNELLALAGEVL